MSDNIKAIIGLVSLAGAAWMLGKRKKSFGLSGLSGGEKASTKQVAEMKALKAETAKQEEALLARVHKGELTFAQMMNERDKVWADEEKKAAQILKGSLW